MCKKQPMADVNIKMKDKREMRKGNENELYG